MDRIFRLPSAVREDPAVDAWFDAGGTDPRYRVRPWFDRMRGCGPDVRILIHDGRPTACLGDAAFGYVDAFSAHAAIGFFHGAAIADPAALLLGSGKRMRHVRLRPGEPLDSEALGALIDAAYRDICARLSEAS